ncbi:MAG: hypothetical protein AAF620_00145 [Bacteroidota bacterium]
MEEEKKCGYEFWVKGEKIEGVIRSQCPKNFRQQREQIREYLLPLLIEEHVGVAQRVEDMMMEKSNRGEKYHWYPK